MYAIHYLFRRGRARSRSASCSPTRPTCGPAPATPSGPDTTRATTRSVCPPGRPVATRSADRYAKAARRQPAAVRQLRQGHHLLAERRRGGPFVNELPGLLLRRHLLVHRQPTSAVTARAAAFFKVSAADRPPDDLCHRAVQLRPDRRQACARWSRPRAANRCGTSSRSATRSPRTTGPSASRSRSSAAVWSSIIHGARGIIYFNHSFAGTCQSPHALRESCYADMRAAVKKVNGQIKTLAPVLNAPFADGVAKVNAGFDISTKWYNGHFYVLARATRPAAGGRRSPYPAWATPTSPSSREPHAELRRAPSPTRSAGTPRPRLPHRRGSSCGAY